VLHFKPLACHRWSQSLELTTGELIPGQPPLLKCRKVITREEAIKLWTQKRKEGWELDQKRSLSQHGQRHRPRRRHRSRASGCCSGW
jgi:hypothetical protein